MVDRVIVHPTVEVLDVDILQSNKDTMVGLGYLAQAILGTGTVVDGLACTPTIPASMGVNVATGSIYSFGQIDATDYGTIPADTVNQIMKQGIVIGTTHFNCPAPGSVGQSVVYLIQAKFQENDGGATNLPYIDATDGSVSYAITNTVRQGVCVLTLKTGTAATTGTQTTPSPDSGYVGLWAITVANGATTITSGNIVQVATAPFFGKLPTKIATVKRQIFTSSGTYTPSQGLIHAYVEAFGGGGGGGGAPGGTGTQAAAATGGGAGGECSKIIPAATIGNSQTVTIGAAGTNGAAGNTNGGSGGSSSFGAILTAGGGSPGGGQAAQTVISLSNAPGVGGSASGGDINLTGAAGGYGMAYGGSSIGVGGKGADSRYGRGGNGGATGSGGNATGYGAGGGGGAANTSDAPGGSGTPGIVIVTEYLSQ